MSNVSAAKQAYQRDYVEKIGCIRMEVYLVDSLANFEPGEVIIKYKGTGILSYQVDTMDIRTSADLFDL